MENTDTRPHLIRHRVQVALATLALALFGAGFAACGDDEEDEAAETVQQEAEEIGQEAEEQAGKAGEEAEQAGEEAKEKAQEVEKDAEKEIGY